MEDFMTQLCIISAFLSLFTVVLSLFRSHFQSFCKAGTRLKIELLVLLRALFIFPIFIRFFTALPRLKSNIQVIARQTESIVYTALSPFKSEPLSIDPWFFLFVLWLAIGCLIFLLSLVSDLLCGLDLKNIREPFSKYRDVDRRAEVEQIIAQLVRELNISDPVLVYRAPGLTSPGIVVGPRKIILYLSDNVLECKKIRKKSFRMILRHEFVHYLHHDQWKDLLIRLVCAINWFNPFVYLLSSIVRQDIEQACDDKALEGEAEEMRKVLQNALVNIAETMATKEKPILGIRFFSPYKKIRGRLVNINDKRPLDTNRYALPICAIITAATLMINFNGIFELQLMGTGASIDNAEILEVVSEGKIPFSLPIQNPNNISASDWFNRHHNYTVNQLILAAEVGTNVYAPISGKIVYSDYNENANKGYSIVIQNEQIIVTVSHLKPIGLNINDNINQNDLIGKVDLSGKTSISSCELSVVDITGKPVDLSMYI